MIEVRIEIDDRYAGNVVVTHTGPTGIDSLQQLVDRAVQSAARAAGYPGGHWPGPEKR